MVLPQDGQCTLLWEVNFDYEIFESREENYPDTALRLPNDGTSSLFDNDVTEKGRRFYCARNI